MDGPHKKGKSDSKGEVHSPGTPAEKARPWTQEGMEAAEPYPLPEVPDGEAEVARVITDVRVSSEELEVVLGDGTIVCLSLRSTDMTVYFCRNCILRTVCLV